MNSKQLFRIMLNLFCVLLPNSSYFSVSATERKFKVLFHLEQPLGRRMVEMIYNMKEETDNIIDCYVYGHKYIIDEALLDMPIELVRNGTLSDVESLINTCIHVITARTQKGQDAHIPYITAVTNGIQKIRLKYQNFFIFPGTKWCGAGNVASHSADFGSHLGTDWCCREHDYCPDSIEGFQTKHGLENPNFYTVSNCSCDEDFAKCLQDDNSKASMQVGHIYFNLGQMPCFKLEHPIVRCVGYAPRQRSLPIPCQRYELDMTSPKEWQFFDSVYFQS